MKEFTPSNLNGLNFPELERIFTNHFDSLALKHSYYNVFDHYLDTIINGFCFNYDQNIMEHIRNRYSQNERYVFGEMLIIWIKIMDIKISVGNDFFDWFGYYYEKNAMSKQHGFAQYFTPEEICKMMVMLLMDKGTDNQKIYEPTCGSGRLNLASHAVNNKMYHVANDLDYTCAKMSALNFMVHGIKGIVTCDDGLLPKSKFRGAFIINERFAPSIRFISDANEAYFYINTRVGVPAVQKTKSLITQKNEINTEFLTEQYQIKADKKGQLTLF